MPAQLLPWAQALIALLGIALASLPSLTSKARLRNRITFWTAQGKDAKLEYDRKFAESLRRDATARLVALEAYPAWHFLAATYGTFLGVGLAWVVGSDMGGTYPDTWMPERLFNSDNPDMALPGLPIVGPIFLVFGVMRLARVVVLRQRVAEQYLRGETIRRGTVAVRKSDKVVAIEDAQGPMHLKLSVLLGLLSFSLGLYIVIIVVSFSVVSGAIPGKPDDSFLTFVLYGAMLGTMLTLIGALSVIDLFLDEKKRWNHPRELFPAASIVRTANSPDVSEQQPKRGRWSSSLRRRSRSVLLQIQLRQKKTGVACRSSSVSSARESMGAASLVRGGVRSCGVPGPGLCPLGRFFRRP
jgi:hypothetical protein